MGGTIFYGQKIYGYQFKIRKIRYGQWEISPIVHFLKKSMTFCVVEDHDLTNNLSYDSKQNRSLN